MPQLESDGMTSPRRQGIRWIDNHQKHVACVFQYQSYRTTNRVIDGSNGLRT